MEKKQFERITEDTFNFLNNKGVNFICYIWDRDGKHGGGCQSAEADMFDAMVAIERMVKRFNIDPDRLFTALQEAKRDMEGN